MTQDRDIERLLERWLSDGPTQASDRVFDEAVDRIDRQRQRPVWLLRRELPMSSLFKVAVVAAAVLVVAVVGFGLVRPSGPGSNGIVPGVGSSPSASSSAAPVSSLGASASVAPVACEDGLACLGALEPGSHSSGSFQPKLFYETPAGWTNTIDVKSIFKLDPPATGDPYILAWTGVRIARQTSSCGPTVDATRGDSAADWIAFIQAHPGLTSSAPVPLTLPPGNTGTAIDLAVSPTWTATCPGQGDEPTVLLLNNGYGLPQTQRLHFVAFDVEAPGCTECQRSTVVTLTYSYGSPSEARFISETAAARSIIETFKLGCGPAFNSGPCGGGAR